MQGWGTNNPQLYKLWRKGTLCPCSKNFFLIFSAFNSPFTERRKSTPLCEHENEWLALMDNRISGFQIAQSTKEE